jgi:hypothetical protein
VSAGFGWGGGTPPAFFNRNDFHLLIANDLYLSKLFRAGH